MPDHHASSTNPPSPKASTTDEAKFVGAAAIAGIAGVLVATTAILQQRPARLAQRSAAARRKALRSYLVDHLAGSDTAFRVVSHLKDSKAGTAAGALFAELHEEFAMERSVVENLLTDLGGSIDSPKRVVGKVAGGGLQALAGGVEGDMALFRTFEALAVGVQGKRLLWRALRELALDSPSPAKLDDLEALALDQWTRIESMRRQLAPKTFGVVMRDLP